MRDLWTAKRRRQAHHKRHHDTPEGRTTLGSRPQIAVVRRSSDVVRRTVRAVASRFRLYDGRTTLSLGSFASRRAAWLAADEHLLRRLASCGDWVLGEYLVVSDGIAGALDIESQITHLGPADDLEACQHGSGLCLAAAD